MSSTQEKPLDLSPLNDAYDIVGEISRREMVRTYPGKRRSDGRDVLIAVMRAAPDVSQGKAIAQFAADVNLLVGLKHPNVPSVLEGRWIGDDAFALVTDRVQGTTLAELLKGERLSNPRIADILGDVDGVLEWARGERLSHRNVTPDDIWIERGTGKVYVTPSPTDAPKTNRPDARDDARTIGSLAMTMLTAKPMADDHDGTLIDMRPDLPQRVVDATEKVAACTINDEQPDISAYLASLAMADAIKEGELEVARVEAEFRAQMKAEREKWEAEQAECEASNELLAKKFAEERAEYERRVAKEKEQLASARGEIDKRRTEVQEARTELDQARAAHKQKRSDLDARAKQVDKQISELEKQKRSLEKRGRELERQATELEERNKELKALAALAASGAAEVAANPEADNNSAIEDLLVRINHADEINRPTQELSAITDEEIDEPEPVEAAAVTEEVVADEEPPAWKPIETKDPWAVPLETDEPASELVYEAAAVPEPEKKEKGSSRRRWVMPVSIVGVIAVLVGTAYGISRRDRAPQIVSTIVAAKPAANPPKPEPAIPTAAIGGGMVVDSQAGMIALPDSSAFTQIRDSIIGADAARRERRRRAEEAAEAAAAERRRNQTIVDSTGQVWSLTPPPPADSVRRADSISKAMAIPPVVPPPIRFDTTRTKPDTMIRPKPDTLIRPKPDTGSVRRPR